jgi:hypothetical protein
MKKLEEQEPTCPIGRQKISISKTLRKRGLTEEEILKLESFGLLRKYGINKSAESRYIEYFWYKNTGQ